MAMYSVHSIKARMNSVHFTKRFLASAVGIVFGLASLTASAQSVDITAPADGLSATVNVPISLSADADGGDQTISRVKFKQNGAYISTGDQIAPYTETFTPTAPGTYVFTAEVIHVGTVLATSAPVTVTVTSCGGCGGNNVAPTVSLSSNPTTAAAPATFNLTATAADSDGTIANVKFYADGGLLSTDTTAPFAGTYTTSVSGSHSLTAVATDNSGTSTTSAGVTVTVTGGGGGGGGSGPTSVTRTYVYDTNERLCKVIDPESGATVMDYDTSGNIAWIATGTNLATGTCDRASVTAAQKAIRTYDALNRMTNVATPGGAADVATKYTPDGLVSSLVAANGAAGTNPVTTTYAYNKRRLLVSESSAQATYSYNLAYAYDANGHLSSLQYPDLQIVTYAPDGLGRVTAVQAGTQTYANGVNYFANGAISGFTYGNGVVHTMTQNARQLPTRSLDKKGATVVLDDTYAFDRNGNVTDITDQAQNGLTTRGMGYDALDRLTAAISPQQWGNATYTYDAIDNIRTANQGARQLSYNYDLVSNRLTSISGTSSYSFGYDARGNITSKGAQDFTFDPSNRMTTAELLSSTSLQTYRYDGTGRRVQTTDPGGQSNLWVYSQAAQVVYNHDERRGQNLAYIYLGNTQVATRTFDYSHGGTVSIRYQHTDALGSPVAETDASGAVLKRNAYAPYGEAYGATSIDGTGYTGHVMDKDTGLTYMQQRYYDPMIGRFLSIDSVAVDSKAGGNFGRYWYAGNNPYRFTDPDGRCFWDGCVTEVIVGAAIVGAAVGLAVEGVKQARAGNFDGKRLAVAGAVGAASGAALAVVGGTAIAGAVAGAITAETATAGIVAGGAAVGGASDSATRALNGDPQSLRGSVTAAVAGGMMAPVAVAAEPVVGSAVGATVGSKAVPRVGYNFIRSNRPGSSMFATAHTAARPAATAPLTAGYVTGLGANAGEATVKATLDKKQ